MSDNYEPTDAEIREQVLWQFDGHAEVTAGVWFDRWLARVKAEAAAVELEEVANEYVRRWGPDGVPEWLESRAAELRVVPDQ